MSILGALKPLALIVATIALVEIAVSSAHSQFFRDATGYPLGYRGPFAVCPCCAGDSGYFAAEHWRCPRCNVGFSTELRDGKRFGINMRATRVCDSQAGDSSRG